MTTRRWPTMGPVDTLDQAGECAAGLAGASRDVPPVRVRRIEPCAGSLASVWLSIGFSSSSGHVPSRLRAAPARVVERSPEPFASNL